MAPQLLWIGLGNMGRGMCLDLVQKGSLDKPLLVYDRTQKRSDDFVTQVGSSHAKRSSSLHEGVGSSDIIFSCLSSDSAVVEIFEPMIKDGDARGKPFVECSTISHELVDKIPKLIIDHGAEFVSSPGVMGHDEISFEDEPHSNAAKVKLIDNAFAPNAIAQLAESLTLAEKSGISTAMVKKFADIMYGGIYSVYSGRMLSGEYWARSEPYASADIALKDTKHLLGLGQEANMELKNILTGLGYLQKAIRKSPGDQVDVSAIYGAVREANGLEFKGQDEMTAFNKVLPSSGKEDVLKQARLLGAIVQQLIFDTAMAQGAAWNLHLTAALGLFRDTIETHGQRDGFLDRDADLQAIAPSSSMFNGIHLDFTPWSQDQNAFQFFAAFLIYADVISGVASGTTQELQTFHRMLIANETACDSRQVLALKTEDYIGCPGWILAVLGKISAIDASQNARGERERREIVELKVKL
ncbi:hypothetical protein LZL87_012167 [Fusarium oxysporum]|nr:hypothetical protein LZL87_012167 [Fusarium oxysporum]